MLFSDHPLVSRLVGDGESQAESCILIDGAAPVLAAHPADGGKPCTDEAQKNYKEMEVLRFFFLQVFF